MQLCDLQKVVVNGAGLCGLEIAGDIRGTDPNKEIIVLSRNGKVFSDYPEYWQDKVNAALEKMNIKVVKGTVPSGFTQPRLEPGKIDLTNDGEVTSLEYDVFLPMFAQGPNTDMFAPKKEGEQLAEQKILDDSGRIIANDCLQSVAFPNIFGVGVTTQPLLGHPVSCRVAAQAKTCARNAKLIVQGKSAEKHVDKESPPAVSDGFGGINVPLTIKIGHGPKGYMIWNHHAFPCPIKCLCCIPCGGGYPCCPCPCCWCCGKGISGACGKCGGPPEGHGPAAFMEGFLLDKFLAPHGYKGVGQLPPSQQKMK